MRKSTKVTWESFSENGERFVRETFDGYVAILGPLDEFETFTSFIQDRRFLIENAVWLELRRIHLQNEAEERRNQALKEFLEKRDSVLSD